jgi:hypothetical protein
MSELGWVKKVSAWSMFPEEKKKHLEKTLLKVKLAINLVVFDLVIFLV